MKLALIPQPQTLVSGKGFFSIPRTGSIGISDHTLHPAADTLRPVFGAWPIGAAIPSVKDPVRILLRKGFKPQGYRLRITLNAVIIEAGTPAGAYYAVQTLRQIALQNPKDRLPVLTINDWPDFAARGLYYDVCRGRVPKEERLLEQIGLLASFKLNQYQLYIEHTFRYRGHPLIGRGVSPLTAEDMLEIDSFCRECHVDFVPSQASFGHLQPVLTLKPYRHLAEDRGIRCYVSPEAEKLHPWQKLKGWTLSPANPGTYTFLGSLYSELLPLFSSDKFNACCDETYDLGLGQSYELCKKLGKGRVYLGHIIKLNRLCHKHGKKLMFWGDIIRHYPELISRIPRDVTVLDWGYAFNHPFERISDFKKAGLKFYACPGTSSWVSLFPRLHEASANIRGFVAAAKKHGADGILNTDWGDGGHYNFMEFCWHGYLLGAEQSWNSKADAATFTARFAKLFLNNDDPALAKAIDRLGDISHLSAGCYQSIWQHLFFAPAGNDLFKSGRRDAWISRNGRISTRKLRLDAALGRATLAQLAAVRKVFVAASRAPGADPHGILPYWIFAVDTTVHAARKLTVLGQGGTDSPAARKALKAEMASLMGRFEKLWLARNRRSEINVTLKRYRAAMKSL